MTPHQMAFIRSCPDHWIDMVENILAMFEDSGAALAAFHDERTRRQTAKKDEPRAGEAA